MAYTASFAESALFMIDQFPGQVNTGWEPPQDSDGNIFTNSTHQKTSSPQQPAFHKVELLDPVRGPATFIYLQVGTMEAANGLVIGDLVGLQHASGVLDGKVTNDDDVAKVNLGGPAAIALSTWTFSADDNKWGWFFCGGRVPITLVSAFVSGTFGTDGNVTATNGLSLVADSSTLAFGIAAATKLTIGLSAIIDS